MQFTNGDDAPMENWKQFQGTELGSLMGQIYGNQNKPKINYPTPKTKKQEIMHTERFLGSGGKSGTVGGTDPRKATSQKVAVNVPKNFKSANSESNFKAIDAVSRRRSTDVIKAELDEIKMRQIHYRPAHVHAIGDSEKDRLSQVFTYKGGKGLPTELTGPIGEAPFERQARMTEEKRVAAIMSKRGGGPSKANIDAIILSEVDQMREQITNEIEERQQYLTDMKSLNGKVCNEKTIQNEIARKFAELDALDKMNK